MPTPLIVPLTPGITVEANYTLRLVALDPTAGTAVSGVVITQARGLGTNVQAETPPLPAGVPILLVPGPGE